VIKPIEAVNPISHWYMCPNCSLVYSRQPNYTSECEKCGDIELLPIIGKFTLQCNSCQDFHDPADYPPKYTKNALKCWDEECGGDLAAVVISSSKIDIFGKDAVKKAIPDSEYADTKLEFGVDSDPDAINETSFIPNLPPPIVKKHAGLKIGDYIKVNDIYFEIVGKIGKGGMGEIYKGRHWQTDDLVAVKSFMYRAFYDPNSKTNFCEKYWNRERRITEIQSQSPEPSMHIIGSLKLTDWGDPEYYIILEYIHGKVLTEWYKHRYPTPFDLTLTELCFLIKQIIMPISKNLYFIHQFGIVHRDLTPQNLMIVDDGSPQAPYPIIVDWGVAKELGLHSMFNPKKPYFSGATPDATGIRNKGTPPEVMSGLEPMAATDIYMLGHVVYYLFNGGQFCKLPLTHEDFVLHPKTLLTSLLDDFDLIVSKLTQYEPADRLTTMIKVWDSFNFLYNEYFPQSIMQNPFSNAPGLVNPFASNQTPLPQPDPSTAATIKPPPIPIQNTNSQFGSNISAQPSSQFTAQGQKDYSSILNTLLEYVQKKRSSTYIKVNIQDFDLKEPDLVILLTEIAKKIDLYGYEILQILQTLFPDVYSRFVNNTKNFDYMEIILWDCPIERIETLSTDIKHKVIEYRKTKIWPGNSKELVDLIAVFLSMTLERTREFIENQLNISFTKDYHGVLLNLDEYDIIIQLEQLFGKPIPHLKFVGGSAFGFLSQDGYIKELGLFNQNLKEIPSFLQNLPEIEVLILRKNNISSLDPLLSGFSKLEMLNIVQNEINTLPNNIDQLDQLETLAADKNRITSLPSTLTNLKNLKNLYLSHNQITSLPPNLEDIPQLKSISLNHNSFDANSLEYQQFVKILKNKGVIIQ
jgi:serine/threonine protein kinase